MEDRPDLAQWWIDQEARIGGTFRNDTKPYRVLAKQAAAQGRLFGDSCDADPSDLGDCVCTD
jgi:hypothetical protein